MPPTKRISSVKGGKSASSIKRQKRTGKRHRSLGVYNQTASGDDEDDEDYEDADHNLPLALDNDVDEDIPLSNLRRTGRRIEGVTQSAASQVEIPTEPCYISMLPNELLQKILDYVEPETDLTKYEKRIVGMYSIVSERFRQIVRMPELLQNYDSYADFVL